ncbi:MAG TPA: hypothetical protein VK957_06170 [Lunatimonas sp.]|nr:hypothetical protein [Lunatimonas sp.]
MANYSKLDWLKVKLVSKRFEVWWKGLELLEIGYHHSGERKKLLRWYTFLE